MAKTDQEKENELKNNESGKNRGQQSFAEKLILFAVFLTFAAIVVGFAYNWNYVEDGDTTETISFQYTTSTKESTTLGSSDGDVVNSGEKININTATLEQLDTLPGIGPSKAQAIIDYRNKESIFTKPEDLMKVSGIGEKTYEQIKDMITVE